MEGNNLLWRDKRRTILNPVLNLKLALPKSVQVTRSNNNSGYGQLSNLVWFCSGYKLLNGLIVEPILHWLLRRTFVLVAEICNNSIVAWI